MGHRGAMGVAPENTMAAFRLGHAQGADLLECDVHLSADGVAMVIHDPTVDRTTTGHGRVRDLEASALAALGIPSLRELLAWLAAENRRTGREVSLVIEAKAGPCPALPARIVADLAATGMGEHALVISFDHRLLLAVKALSPALPTGALYHARLIDPVAVARAARAEVLGPSVEFLDPELVRIAHEAGLLVLGWTVNTPEDMERAVRSGADVAGTNHPDRLLALLSGS